MYDHWNYTIHMMTPSYTPLLKWQQFTTLKHHLSLQPFTAIFFFAPPRTVSSKDPKGRHETTSQKQAGNWSTCFGVLISPKNLKVSISKFGKGGSLTHQLISWWLEKIQHFFKMTLLNLQWKPPAKLKTLTPEFKSSESSNPKFSGCLIIVWGRV